MTARRVTHLIMATALLAGAALVAVPAAARAPDRAMIEARQKFFGRTNVDARTGAVRADRVILSWFGVANYAAAFNGHVVLLDAWVPRGSHSGYVPTDPAELAALQPELIFLGHGDFDHAADAAEIASISGAPIVGTPEHCDSVRRQAGTNEIRCIEAAARAAPPGVSQELSVLPGVEITAVTHVHSSFESPEYQDGGRLPCIPIWNAQDTVDNPPTPEDMAHLMTHLPDPRGGNILYQFRVGNFALTWHDTTGKIQEDAPQVIDVLETLPATDVHFGPILAFGQVTNCFRSLHAYIEALDPRVFAAAHHDNFTYFIGANAADLEPYVREELERFPATERPELIYTYDPADYLNPVPYTFEVSARRWR